MFRNRACSRTRQRMSEYVDSLLSPSEARAVEGHLAQCEDCRAYFESLQAVVVSLRQLPSVAAPRSFALARQPSPQPLRLFTPLRAATAALAILFLLVVAGRYVGFGQLATAPGAPQRQTASTEAVRPTAIAGQQPQTAPALSETPGESAETKSAPDQAGGFAVAPPSAAESTSPEPSGAAPRPASSTPEVVRPPLHLLEALLLLAFVALAAATALRWRVESRQ